ncbi:MAG: GNAT family N-acetyltransferase [Candidatus Thiodiazotropha weberae]|uniref:N-acetyltransferase domain-containing protein n=1 Tax=Candidatus Thiodiazotropha endoloripes TaxID=1818881 RepID=A0A1E2UNQ9_9GAMM|nr:GNAT family N-acetyltransferase [Candidatus Thiodiazotropha endoloripes]MCG7899892.1 GNAT family N-acetyltransferase [Candidatus Thiodiazotropha weberae]ODB96346.1 hypothetical protein A3196_05980 [Candidatus Thiodiazotropha endoloripes]
MKNRWFALWWHRFLRNIWLQFIANPEALKVRMQSDGFVLVAVQDDTIVGRVLSSKYGSSAVCDRQASRYSKKLLARSLDKASISDPNLSKLIVHSSPYVEPIYKKMGFYITGSVETDSGITYISMELLLQHENT